MFLRRGSEPGIHEPQPPSLAQQNAYPPESQWHHRPLIRRSDGHHHWAWDARHYPVRPFGFLGSRAASTASRPVWNKNLIEMLLRHRPEPDHLPQCGTPRRSSLARTGDARAGDGPLV